MPAVLTGQEVVLDGAAAREQGAEFLDTPSRPRTTGAKDIFTRAEPSFDAWDDEGKDEDEEEDEDDEFFDDEDELDDEELDEEDLDELDDEEEFFDDDEEEAEDEDEDEV